MVRLNTIRIKAKMDLEVPAFFPSISSVKANMIPINYVRLLSALTALNHQFLVSAFDLVAMLDLESAKSSLEKSISSGTIVLMDSGNYESYWKNAQANWTQIDFYDALRAYPFSFAFAFDCQNLPASTVEQAALILDWWRQDQLVASDRMIVPIIHTDANYLPAMCAQIASGTGATMIAVPERRLGEGILERSHTIVAIRTALNALDHYVALHLLGTGNPVSIALYSVLGADSFDGLEWCQTVVDHESGLLFHMSQADFFRAQTIWGDEDVPFQARTLAHNLAFYADWMKRLREAVHTDDGIGFCRRNFPERIFQRCSAAFGWK